MSGVSPFDAHRVGGHGAAMKRFWRWLRREGVPVEDTAKQRSIRAVQQDERPVRGPTLSPPNKGARNKCSKTYDAATIGNALRVVAANNGSLNAASRELKASPARCGGGSWGNTHLAYLKQLAAVILVPVERPDDHVRIQDELVKRHHVRRVIESPPACQRLQVRSTACSDPRPLAETLTAEAVPRQRSDAQIVSASASLCASSLGLAGP